MKTILAGGYITSVQLSEDNHVAEVQIDYVRNHIPEWMSERHTLIVDREAAVELASRLSKKVTITIEDDNDDSVVGLLIGHVSDATVSKKPATDLADLEEARRLIEALVDDHCSYAHMLQHPGDTCPHPGCANCRARAYLARAR